MKKIILSFLMLVSLFTLASCMVTSESKISFAKLPNAVYVANEVNDIMEDAQVIVPGSTTPVTLSEAKRMGCVVTGISSEVGTHTLVVTFQSFSVTFTYEVTSEHLIAKSEQQLRDYLENKAPIIELDFVDDAITTAVPFVIDYPVVIFGNGNSITVQNQVKQSSALFIKNITSGTVALYDLTLAFIGGGGKTTGLDVSNCKNMKLLMDNTSVSCSNYYALNIVNQNEEIEVVMKNGSTAGGYCALYWSAKNSTFKVYDSSLNGHNNASEGASNNFAIIACYTKRVTDNSYNLPGGIAQNNTFEFYNVSFTATSESLNQNNIISLGNYYNSTKLEDSFAETDATGNKFIFEGCQFSNNTTTPFASLDFVGEADTVVIIDGEEKSLDDIVKPLNELIK